MDSGTGVDPERGLDFHGLSINQKITSMKKAFVFVVLLLFAGCSSLGILKPRSFDDGYAYAMTTNAAIRTAAQSALETGAIDVDAAEYVLLGTDGVRVALDQALAVKASAPDSASEMLDAALSSIGVLMEFLKGKGVSL